MLSAVLSFLPHSKAKNRRCCALCCVPNITFSCVWALLRRVLFVCQGLSVRVHSWLGRLQQRFLAYIVTLRRAIRQLTTDGKLPSSCKSIVSNLKKEHSKVRKMTGAKTRANRIRCGTILVRHGPAVYSSITSSLRFGVNSVLHPGTTTPRHTIAQLGSWAMSSCTCSISSTH